MARRDIVKTYLTFSHLYYNKIIWNARIMVSYIAIKTRHKLFNNKCQYPAKPLYLLSNKKGQTVVGVKVKEKNWIKGPPLFCIFGAARVYKKANWQRSNT
jgi:hypothetical protein